MGATATYADVLVRYDAEARHAMAISRHISLGHGICLRAPQKPSSTRGSEQTRSVQDPEYSVQRYVLL